MRILLLREAHVSEAQLLDPNSLLFGRWGSPTVTLSTNCVKDFTGRTLGIKLTSTYLRSVQETEAEEARRADLITVGQRGSVSSVSGHSSAVRPPLTVL